MDESCLPGPPLTVTYSMAVTYRDATPPNTPLIVRARVRLDELLALLGFSASL